jgi:hypothetical protein
MPPAAGGSGVDPGSNDQISSATSMSTPVVATLVGFAALFLISFSICVFAYRRSRLRKAKIDRRVKREREWTGGHFTDMRQEDIWGNKRWMTLEREEINGRRAVLVQEEGLQLPLNPTVSSNYPDGEAAGTMRVAASIPPPPPAYRKSEDYREGQW